VRRKKPSRAPAATGPSGQKLWLAVHECGHAVAQLVLDELPPYPGPFLRSVSIVADANSLGRVEGQPRVCLPIELGPHLDDRQRAYKHRQLRYDIIQHLAGYIAELHHKDGPMGTYFARDAVVRRTVSGELDASTDFSLPRQQLEWISHPNPTAELTRLWNITCSLIGCEWAGLQRISRALLAREFMDGEDFEQEWLKCRSTESARRLAEKRHGHWRDALEELAPTVQLWDSQRDQRHSGR
jgi:hypothetical protein